MALRTKAAPLSDRHEIGANSYIEIFRLAPSDRIRMIKDGVTAIEAKRVLADLAMAQGDGLAALNLAAATVNRKAVRNETLSRDDSERVIGAAKLIGQVQAMVEDSGDAVRFDAAAWMARWLQEPLPAFGGRRPIEFLDTIEGQALVGSALARMQSGAYA